ncbi:hypothetical protein [Streptomyces sp. NPDC002845]
MKRRGKQCSVRWAALGLAVLPLVAACGGGDDEGADEASEVSSSPVAVVAPAKVEVIASLTGCEVQMRVEAEQLREGACHTPEGDYLITTFPEEKLKQVWLDTNAIYGGTYLVGPRWAIGAEREVLDTLREKVGGTIQKLRGTTGGAATAPSSP